MFADHPITVYALGSEAPTAQVARIRKGLVAHEGVTLTEDMSQADLVYVNNFPYDAPLHARAAGCLKPEVKLVFNVLDVPSHLLPPQGDYTIDKLAALGAQLSEADAVTSISRFVQNQLRHYFADLPSHVIYNPIKEVTPDVRLSGMRPYPYRVLMAGRVGDPNKRMRSIGIPALMMAGFEEYEVAVIGGEWPGWGTNLGMVSDGQLNDLYNSVDFVLQPTANAGLELPPLEGMICGAVPIVCHDLTTFHEFPYPPHWGCYPSATAVALWLRALMSDPAKLIDARDHCLAMGSHLRHHLSQAAVAERILQVYRRLIKWPRELRSPEGWTKYPESI